MPIRRSRSGFRRDGSAGQGAPDLAQLLESSLWFTYALYDGGSIKIGKTKGHPILRLRTLQTGNPNPLSLIAYTIGMTEAQAHRKLSRHRVRGEWFRPSAEVMEELKKWTWIDKEIFERIGAD